MAENAGDWWTTEEGREEQAGRVLEAYTERRRRRRAEDTYFGSVHCLVPAAEADLSRDDLQRRREDILREAEEAGMSPELAVMLYDIAREEGLDPALGYELVRCGLGVQPPEEGVTNAPDHPVTDKYRPEWLGEPVPPDSLLRERGLRLSFRRLRRLLEEHDDAGEALHAFVREPDVGLYGY